MEREETGQDRGFIRAVNKANNDFDLVRAAVLRVPLTHAHASIPCYSMNIPNPMVAV